MLAAQGLHSWLLMTGGGGGGVRQRFIIYTPKNQNFRICLPKKITTFLAYPQKTRSPFFPTQKMPLFDFATQKYLGVLHRLKKSFWPKFQT